MKPDINSNIFSLKPKNAGEDNLRNRQAPNCKNEWGMHVRLKSIFSVKKGYKVGSDCIEPSVAGDFRKWFVE